MKFTQGSEIINLPFFPVQKGSRSTIEYTSVTISIWIKLETAPPSNAYILKYFAPAPAVKFLNYLIVIHVKEF